MGKGGLPAVRMACFLNVADITLDLLAGRAYRAGKRLNLHPAEFRLFVYLCSKAPQPVSVKELHEVVIGRHWHEGSAGLLAVHVHRLRVKLDRYGGDLRIPQNKSALGLIVTEKGLNSYRIKPEVSLVASTNK